MPGAELEAGRAFVDLVPRLGAGGVAKMEAEVGGAFSGLAGKASLAGKAIGVGLAGGVVAGGAALFAIGKNFDDAFDKIRVETGKTGAALEGLQTDFKSVVSSVPTDFDSAATAISGFNKGLGLTGPALDSLSSNVLELSRITETDLAANVENVSGLFNSWGIAAEDQVPKLDVLFRASQATGVSVTDLSAAMAAGGSQLRQVGLDFEESAALIGLLGKVGLDAGSIMGPLSKAIATAAKEGKSADAVLSDVFATIRGAPDDTTAAGAAIEVFGAKAGPKLAGLIREGKLSYEDLAATIASGGDTIMAASADTQDASEKMQVAWNRVQVALEPVASAVFDLVGSLADKLAPVIAKVADSVGRFFKALTTGFTEDEGSPLEDFALMLRRDLLPVIQKIGDFIGDHLTPIMIGLGVVVGGLAIGALVSALVALVGAISAPVVVIAALAAALIYAYQESETFRNIVDGIVSFLVDVAAPAIADFASAVAEQISHLAEWWSEHWDSIQEAVSHVVAVISAVISTFVAAVELVWDHFGDTIMAVVTAAWDFVKAYIEFAIGFIRGIIEAGLALINGDFGQAWDAIKGIFSSALDFIKSLVSSALSVVRALFTDSLSAVTDTVRTSIDTVVSFFYGIGGRIAGVAGDVFGFLVSSFKGAINSIVGAWNSFKIPSVPIGGWDPPGPGPSFPSVSTPEINFPDIPYLAEGADILRTGLAIVGDDGPELLNLPRGARVSPLDRLDSLAGARGPAVAIENATFSDEVDVDLLLAKASFMATAGRFD